MKPLMKMMGGAGLGQKLSMMKGLGDLGALQGGKMPKLKQGTTRFDPREREKKRRRRR